LLLLSVVCPVLHLCMKLWAASSTDMEVLRYLIWLPSAILDLLRKIVERHTNAYSRQLSHVKMRNGRHCSVDVIADFYRFYPGQIFIFLAFWLPKFSGTLFTPKRQWLLEEVCVLSRFGSRLNAWCCSIVYIQAFRSPRSPYRSSTKTPIAKDSALYLPLQHAMTGTILQCKPWAAGWSQ